MPGSLSGFYWRRALEIYSLKIARQSDFPICANWQAVKFVKKQMEVGELRAGPEILAQRAGRFPLRARGGARSLPGRSRLPAGLGQ